MAVTLLGNNIIGYIDHRVFKICKTDIIICYYKSIGGYIIQTQVFGIRDHLDSYAAPSEAAVLTKKAFKALIVS